MEDAWQVRWCRVYMYTYARHERSLTSAFPWQVRWCRVYDLVTHAHAADSMSLTLESIALSMTLLSWSKLLLRSQKKKDCASFMKQASPFSMQGRKEKLASWKKRHWQRCVILRTCVRRRSLLHQRQCDSSRVRAPEASHLAAPSASVFALLYK